MSKIPLSALAGVLMVTAWRMNEWHEIKEIFNRRFKSEMMQYLLTLIATVVFDLTIAILVGILFSLIAFISRTLEISLDHSMVDTKRMDEELDMDKIGSTCVVYITGAIFFANTQTITSYLQTIPKAERVILSIRGVSVVDPDAALSLLEIFDNYREQGVELLICGLNPNVRKVLERAGVIDAMGEDKFYWSVDRALIHKQKA